VIGSWDAVGQGYPPPAMAFLECRREQSLMSGVAGRHGTVVRGVAKSREDMRFHPKSTI
jgi:hypothetical protein